MLVDFYQLGASPVERVLPRICERVVETGERLLIVAGADHLTRIDVQLWTYARDSFLPHGLAAGPAPERQPILLADSAAPLNGAANIALVDGEWRGEALGFGRCFYFFDAAHDEEALATWQALGAKADVEARYWKQGAKGKWVTGP
ncbi:MAG TPA: DNA polymerase III subunit chi [Allosphingosinicella sp.]|nr:DNA polymerase III subunit chi [Allosphingosinicella sp.]